MTNDSKKTHWPIEGAAHDDVGRHAIYIDANIASFLDYDRQPILIASKGMGKTLLLRSKKKILEEKREGYLIIPRGLEYDEPKIFGDIPQSYHGYSKPEFWSELWRASILFSILSHGYEYLVDPSAQRTWNQPRGARDSDLTEYLNRVPVDDDFRASLVNDIRKSAGNNPSYYFGDLLRRSLTTAEKLRRNAHILKSISERIIHSGVCVFIDAFDQTLTDHFAQDLEVWKNAQIGLVLAAHYLNTENHHIKVFASIRQEAFAGYFGQHREVIKGKSILLEYDRDDLRAMFLKGVQQYSAFETIEQFVGLDHITNEVFGVDEDVFKYIYRHSSNTPRSVMYFGQMLAKHGLHDCEQPEATRRVKKTVNDVSAKNIRDDYLKGQRAIFLNALREPNAVTALMSTVSANILNVRAMAAINNRFAELQGISPDESHPFCELFNIGLLGTHRADPVTLEAVQYFRKPHEFDWKQAEMIRPESIYFLHPALHAELIDNNPRYRIKEDCVIGDGYPWPFKDATELFPLVFMSHSSLDKEYIEACLPVFDYHLSLLCPHNIWYDKWNIKPGQNIHQEVEKGVHGSDIVLIFLSKNSLESGWVEKEWRTKHMAEIESGEINVIGVVIDDTTFKAIPTFLSDKLILRFPSTDSQDFEKRIQELTEGVWHALGTHTKQEKG